MLQFYDGSSQDAPEITNMCGRDIPSQNSTVQSTSNVMFMVMRSDGSVQRQGFNATYDTGEIYTLYIFVYVIFLLLLFVIHFS